MQTAMILQLLQTREEAQLINGLLSLFLSVSDIEGHAMGLIEELPIG
jgi:hypothetical protein